MLSHRMPRRNQGPGLANETRSYQWRSEFEAGFERCSLRFDSEGRLVTVDFEMRHATTRSETKSET